MFQVSVCQYLDIRTNNSPNNTAHDGISHQVYIQAHKISPENVASRLLIRIVYPLNNRLLQILFDTLLISSDYLNLNILLIYQLRFINRFQVKTSEKGKNYRKIHPPSLSSFVSTGSSNVGRECTGAGLPFNTVKNKIASPSNFYFRATIVGPVFRNFCE